MSRERHARLAALDKAHVWHPFTQMQGWDEEDPLIIERAEGSWLIDDEGKRYLDGVSSLWVTVHGHRKKELDDAVCAQLDRVAHSTLLGLASVPSLELAAELVKRAPAGLTKVFYSDSGSTSVEVALKMAFQFWRQSGRPERKRFLALGEAYHGDTLGSVSVGGMELFHDIFRPLLFDVLRAPTSYCYRCPLGKTFPSCESACAGEMERMIAEHAHELAAVVVEPLMQGAAGMIAQPKGYLARVAAACRKHDVLLVVDEVATGFGRTGTLFACEQEGVTPDLLCVAKGLTGGYLPLAATLATQKIFDAFRGPFESRRTFFHGHTYTGNPLACAAALANLALFDREHTLDHVRDLEPTMQRGLAAIAELPHVGDIRRRGMMIGIELVKERATKSEYDYATRMGHRVICEARERGVVIRPLGNVVVLMPPLSISSDELALLLDVTRASIERVTA
ncbi:MAG: adenosylmethionine--8-amino-7-oxononanoate transaminase [Deltaproteobacteria bacterium]|nr:adenosylmethionine--8-amino-7-oxononanoate transaminase [Deltaproteobacteria bacterium]